MDLTIEGNAYINGAFQHCCIGVEHGKIVAIKKILKGEKHLDVGSNLVLPAGVDIHVHFRDPGFTHKEDFFTGSQAAAFGGITYVCDMPNTQPPTTTLTALHEKIRSAGKKSVTDFGLYAGVTNTNIKTLPALVSQCCGYKIYLGSTTNTACLDPSHLPTVFRILAKSKKIVLIHAEQEKCLKQHKRVETSLSDHLHAHPAICEEAALKQILRYAKTISAHIHICHLSSSEGVELVKKRSANVSVGVTPHHLLFESEKIQSRSTWFKVNPPIRTRKDREKLWKSLNTGIIDIIESDHAPHTIPEKQEEFNKAPSGMPGVETMYPVLLALVKQDRLSFQRLLPLVCEKPAELLDIPKGSIEVGKDADVVIVDFRNTTFITADTLHSKCGWTPFEGWPAIFPDMVFCRGEILVDNYGLQVKPGFGTFVEGTHV